MPDAIAAESGPARPSVEARLAMGKALRATLPRRLHAEYVLSPRRKDPVATLEAQGAELDSQGGTDPYARMLASPLRFWGEAPR